MTLARGFGGRWQPFAVAAALSLTALAVAFASDGGIENHAHMAARYTARASFAAFLIVFLVSPLWKLWPNELTRTLVRRRRQWGLSFALAHFVHLAALLWFVLGFGASPAAATLFGGSFGYVVLLAMVVTSTDASQRTLGKWWKRLHVFGLYLLWFIFAFSYFGRIGNPEMRGQGLIFFPIAMAALGIRLTARFARRGAARTALAG